jgi:hypothetical protein
MKIIKIKNDNSSFKDTLIEEVRKSQLNFTKEDLSKKTKNDVKFIHITKTAGTTIENIGNKNNYKWGRFDADYLGKFKRNKFETCSIWHVPLKYFEINPYEENILFTIVRNPYERCISEYYCPWSGNRNKKADVKKFNRWIRNKLTKENIVSFLPYYEYFSYNDKIIIDYVLRFENLQEEFNNLFNDIKLDRHDNKHLPFKKYNINNLEKETIKMINNKYQKDFLLFEYEMIKV